jgi:thiol-disulfide isomerase/thioredoxin
MSGALLAAMGILFITGNEQIILGGAGSVKAPIADVKSAPAMDGPIACSSGVPLGSASTQISTTTITQQQGIPTLLEFVSAGCPVCKRMHPVVEAAKQDCSHHGIQTQQIDVSTEKGRQAAATYGILGVPTFLFLNREGNEVARLIGQQPLATLVQSLEILAGQKCDGFRPLQNPTESPGLPGT